MFGIISMYNELAFIPFTADARGTGSDSFTECFIQLYRILKQRC
jgi:hypothetical protein